MALPTTDTQTHLEQSTTGFAKTVTVIVPAWNAGLVLARAIDSILDQDMTDWEVIIVDDGSIDQTADIATSFAKTDQRITVLTNPQSLGAAAARNRAIKSAKGRFIAFLDADDVWSPDKLRLQLADMAHHKAALGFTGFWRDTGSQRRQVRVPATVTYPELLRGNCIGCLTAMYDRKICGTVLMPDLALRQDFALWLTLLKNGNTAHGLDLPLATYHASPTSLSGNKARAIAATWNMYRKHFGLGRIESTRYLWSHLVARLRRG